MFHHLSKFLYKLDAKPVQLIAMAGLALVVGSIIVWRFAAWMRERRTARESWLGLVGDALGAVVKVLLGLTVLAVMALHLSYQAVEFERARGGVTQRNYDAVQMIWGRPHLQRELSAKLVYYTEHYYNKDRLEIDLEKIKASSEVVGYRKEEKEHTLKGSPVVSADHLIELSMNYRRKGGALYPGFDTVCRFTYRLVNFDSRPMEAKLSFPLPSRQGIVDDLTILVDGEEYDRPLEFSGETVGWKLDMAPGAARGIEVFYRSRGLGHLRFEPGSGRELSNYRVKMVCKGISVSELDYPIGCMTPTSVEKAGNDTVLTWQLKRAVTRMGMGLIVPEPKQAGYYVAKVLSAAPKGLVLLLAMLLVTLLTAGGSVRWMPLALVAAAYHLYYLLAANIGDYAPGLIGGMVIAGTALTLLVLLVQMTFYRGLCRWAPVGLFVVFCVIYPMLVITGSASLLLSILYVAMLAYAASLVVLARIRSRGEPPQLQAG